MTLDCPKCRQLVPDSAIDAGACPLCGYPFADVVALDPPPSRVLAVLLILGAGVAVAGSGFAGYHFANMPNPTPQATVPEVAVVTPRPRPQQLEVAPFPHEPGRGSSGDTDPSGIVPPENGFQAISVATHTPEGPVVVVPPKKAGPRPPGVVMKVDPRIAPVRHFDHPDDTAALPDLNNADRVVLTGRVRALRIGSVQGRANLDASGLVAEEVIVTGDLSNSAVVLLNAPNGKVTLGGFVMGSAKVTVTAPGGELLVSANSGCISGGAVVTATVKRVEVAGWMSGSGRLNISFTAGGSLKLTRAEEGALVTYRKQAASDPEPQIDRGELKGGARVIQSR